MPLIRGKNRTSLYLAHDQSGLSYSYCNVTDDSMAVEVVRALQGRK